MGRVGLQGREGRSGAPQDAGGTEVGVLLERLDECEAQGPQGYVIWDIWVGNQSVSLFAE